MKVKKRVLSDLPLCYCVAPLIYCGKAHFLVASEKEYSCLLFDEAGNLVDEVWKGPGGVMSMVQLPGTDGAFLSTHRFYSPNNSREASIVLCWHEGGEWKVRTLARLPFVHRFDILQRDGANYLLACCIKSDCEYKDDWRFPGQTLACRLPDKLENLKTDGELSFTVIKDQMFKNHGYCRDICDGVMTGLVTSEEGVFRFIPPRSGETEWMVHQLISEPVSDAVLLDFDGDGCEELLTLSPFHGDRLRIYRCEEAGYRLVYQHEAPLEFAHAICAAVIGREPMAFVGHRRGERALMAVRWREGKYYTEILDKDVGTANLLHARIDSRDVLIAANREINQVACYELFL